MLTPQELKKSPLFQDIGYENYQQMLDCFQAVQRSYRVDEVIYDFSGPAGTLRREDHDRHRGGPHHHRGRADG